MAKETFTANGYEFTIDDSGSITAKGELQSGKAERTAFNAEKNGVLMTEGTQKGHLVPARQNGPTIKGNITAQDGHLNQSTIKKLENAETRLITNKENPVRIQSERTAFAKNQKKDGLVKPDAYMYNETLTFADGKTETVHLSFSNQSKADQAAQNALVNSMNADHMDSSRPSWMSAAEYNDLMEKTNAELPGIAQEFTQWNNSQSKDSKVGRMQSSLVSTGKTATGKTGAKAKSGSTGVTAGEAAPSGIAAPSGGSGHSSGGKGASGVSGAGGGIGGQGGGSGPGGGSGGHGGHGGGKGGH